MRFRTVAGIAAVLTALLAMAVPASATDLPDPAPHGAQRPAEPEVAGTFNIETATVTVIPDGGTRHGIEVRMERLSRTASGEKPAAPRRHVFLFDSSVRFNPWVFPTCARTVIERQGIAGCPDGSRVGSGRIEFYPAGAAELAVFNTRYPNGSRGMLITIPALGAIFENTFEPVSRPYRDDFRWASDEIIPPDSTPPQDRGASTRFDITFGATYRGRSFVESLAPAGRPLNFGGWSEFVTGQIALQQGQVPRP